MFLRFSAILLGVIGVTKVVTQVVSPGFRAVRSNPYALRRSKREPIVLSEGLHWSVPFIHQFSTYETRTQPYRRKVETFTRDKRKVWLDLVIATRPDDQRLLFFHRRMGSKDEFFRTYLPAIEERVVTECMMDFNASEIAARRNIFMKRLLSRLRMECDVLGVLVDDLFLIDTNVEGIDISFHVPNESGTKSGERDENKKDLESQGR
uniref:Prohibitin n=1 Tax=Stygiella incarcerata TaxID=1712417 RepID=A0A192ZIP2_9EUKA|nr:prohibitin [Stygiella incarcerata]|eukprot:TRINITY_DN677_c1_g1_i1.p1 TRINITY_DN677_c1_g1~~TRINITY_DN677_c1_g1_i1.p1  ORF type:complete len:207 (+),score=49.86 TRINITY_DN677_c1_g1_i1:72-692(+)